MKTIKILMLLLVTMCMYSCDSDDDDERDDVVEYVYKYKEVEDYDSDKIRTEFKKDEYVIHRVRTTVTGMTLYEIDMHIGDVHLKNIPIKYSHERNKYSVWREDTDDTFGMECLFEENTLYKIEYDDFDNLSLNLIMDVKTVTKK